MRIAAAIVVGVVVCCAGTAFGRGLALSAPVRPSVAQPQPLQVADASASPTPMPTSSSSLSPSAESLSPAPSPTLSALPMYSPTPPPPVFTTPGGTGPNDYPYNGSRGPEPVATPQGEAVSPVPLPGTSASPAATPAPGFANLTADEVYGNTAGDMTALGHVDIKYSNYDMLADEARYNHETKIVHATGNIQFVSATGDTATASALDYDTVKDQVTLFDVVGQTSSINASGEQIHGLLYYRGRQVVVSSDGTTTLRSGWVTTCDLSHIAYHLTGREIDIHPNDRVIVHGAALYLGKIFAGALGILVLPISQNVHKSTILPRFGYNSYYGFYVKNYINFYRSQAFYGTYHLDLYQRVGIGIGADVYFTTHRGSGLFSFYNVQNSRQQRSLTGARNAFNANLNYQHMFGQHLSGSANATFLSNSGIFTALPSTSSANVSLTHIGEHSNTSYGLTATRTGASVAFNGLVNHFIAFTPVFTQQFSVGLQDSTNPGVFSRQVSIMTDSHYAARNFDSDLVIQTNHGVQTTTDSMGVTTSTPVIAFQKVPELTLRSHQYQITQFRLPLSVTLIDGLYDDGFDNVTTSRAEANVQIGSAFYRVGSSGDFTGTLTFREDAYGTGDLQGAIVEQYSLHELVGRHFDNTLSYQAQSARGYTPLQSYDRLSSYESVSDIFNVYNGGLYRFTTSANYDFKQHFLSPINYQLYVTPNPYASLSLGESYDPHGTGYSPLAITLSTPLGRNDYFQFAGFYDFKAHGMQGGTYFLQHTVNDCYQIRLAYRQPLKEVDLSFNLLAFPSETVGFGINANGPILPTSFEY